jgi:hypothetical protein
MLFPARRNAQDVFNIIIVQPWKVKKTAAKRDDFNAAAFFRSRQEAFEVFLSLICAR